MDQPRNVADEKQIKNQAFKAKLARDNELNDLRTVLALPAGRRLITRLLAYTNVHGSCWRPGAEIHKRAGEQEVGQFIMREVVMADSKLASEMFIEAYKSELEGD